MNPVIRRLRKEYAQSFVVLSKNDEGKARNWVFSEKCKALGSSFYCKMAADHLVFNLEYNLLRQRLHSNLANPLKNNTTELKIQLMEALILNELLEHTFAHYLDVPREVRRLRADKKILQNLLEEYQFVFSKKDEEIDVGVSFVHRLREEHLNANWYRLLTNRSIRLVDVSAVFAKHSRNYLLFVAMVDNYLRPAMPYVASLFFLPRLLTNLTMMLKHSIPGFWMSEEEKSMLWTHRFKLQFERRWFELCNDLPWAVAGIVNCFVLVGALAPYSLYVSLAFFIYDVLLASIRVVRELSLLDDLIGYYSDMEGKERDITKQQQISSYLERIRARRDFDKQRLGFNVASTVSVVLAFSCALPSFSATPFVPLFGAIWLVSICFINLYLNSILEAKRASDDLNVRAAQALPPQGTATNPSRFFHHNLDVFTQGLHTTLDEDESHYADMIAMGGGV